MIKRWGDKEIGLRTDKENMKNRRMTICRRTSTTQWRRRPEQPPS